MSTKHFSCSRRSVYSRRWYYNIGHDPRLTLNIPGYDLASHRIIFMLLLALYVLVQWPTLSEDPVLKRDDYSLITPLLDVQSVNDYKLKMNSGKILDIQPVRDMTLWLNIKINQITGAKTFHLTNAIIWVIVILTTYFLFLKLDFSTWLATLLAGFLLLHPALLTSTLWLSARKHLLACMFISFATLAVLRNKNEELNSSHLRSVCIIFCFLLSVFSHPIAVLWGFWLGFASLLARSRALFYKFRLTFWFTLFICTFTCLYLNYSYYSGPYLNISTYSKMVDTSHHTGIELLMLGRYFFQLVFPFILSATYYPGAVPNFIGLIFMVLFFWAIAKKTNLQTTLMWGAFIAFPLATVTIRMTNVFVSDTYLLVSSIGFAVLLGEVIQNSSAYRFSKSKVFQAICAVIFTCFVIQDFSWAKAWRTDKELWTYSYRSEKSPRVLSMYIDFLLNDSKFLEALNVAASLHQWDPHHLGIQEQFSKALYGTQEISIENKIRILREFDVKSEKKSAWTTYYLGVFFAMNDDYSQAFEATKEAFLRADFRELNLSIASAEILFFCGKSTDRDCEEIKSIIETKKTLPQWDESLFQKRISELTNF